MNISIFSNLSVPFDVDLQIQKEKPFFLAFVPVYMNAQNMTISFYVCYKCWRDNFRRKIEILSFAKRESLFPKGICPKS